ncbi:MAG: ion transporter [Hyphomicrobiales bacterium]|nr:ion transporter [Hyphomicrobiales bacterium]
MAEDVTNADKDEGLKPELRRQLIELYHGTNKRSRRFRLALLVFDVTTIVFFIASSMIDPGIVYHIVDYAIAAVLLADFIARMIVANRRLRFLTRFTSIADIIVIVSLILPAFINNLAFMRVVRMLRLMRSYHVLKEFREFWPFFRKNEEIIQSTINLSVFVFVLTAVVYVLEGHRNPNINNYLDALYFTVTTLTTTGFGDITMQDTVGRVVAVIIMVFGVALFLRLVQTVFRPTKVNFACPNCGLNRHDPDAVHCKHCGLVLNIPTEGDW